MTQRERRRPSRSRPNNRDSSEDASDTHLRPECEEPMVLRTGGFEPFWGCARHPRRRGVIRDAAPEPSVPTH